MSPYTQRLQHLELYSAAVADFFQAKSGEAAVVRTAFLLDKSQPPVLWNDFNSIIHMDGLFVGSVCFSASRKLLSHLLLLSGKSKYEDEEHVGLVDQLTAQFSGRLRTKYGAALRVSSPEGFCGKDKAVHKRSKSSPCAIAFSWRGYEAGLVIDVQPAAATA